MTATSQEQFEQSYSEYTGHPLEFIKLARQSNDSYSVPRIATAYTWWKRAREVQPA
jgi:hypothetical protein